MLREKANDDGEGGERRVRRWQREQRLWRDHGAKENRKEKGEGRAVRWARWRRRQRRWREVMEGESS
ncbi:hypothetical protein PIB30_044332, partial [Stylosanthes scabra]|nr:hypothetical protein [Stylosanthes scabra]